MIKTAINVKIIVNLDANAKFEKVMRDSSVLFPTDQPNKLGCNSKGIILGARKRGLDHIFVQIVQFAHFFIYFLVIVLR